MIDIKNWAYENSMDNLILADGFDEAFIGVSDRDGLVAVYSINKCIEILKKRDEMTTLEAEEFMEFNVINTYFGPKTPIFITTP